MRTKGLLLGDDPDLFRKVWSEELLGRLAGQADFPAEVVSGSGLRSAPVRLSEIEVAFSTWGMPALTPEQLDLLPRLKAVFYAAGTTKAFAKPLLERGILIVNAAAANAVPVAEFTLSQILFSLKLGWNHLRQLQENPSPEGYRPLPIPGAYGSTVGIVSLGAIGRRLCDLLRPFSLRKIAYDPVISPETFAEFDAEPSGLADLFATSEVVTIHTPWLKETEGLITGELISSMKPCGTLINTARGAVIREGELIEALSQRPDLTAVLDVTYPEPPAADSPLYRMPNVILTPHIAGSCGREVCRMAEMMIEEFQAWRQGSPSQHAVTLVALASAA